MLCDEAIGKFLAMKCIVHTRHLNPNQKKLFPRALATTSAVGREIQVTCKPPRKKKTGANATQYNEIRMCTCICRRRCHQQKYARGLLKSAGKHTCDHGTESMGIADTLAEKNLDFLSEQAPRVWRIVVQDSSVIKLEVCTEESKHLRDWMPFKQNIQCV
jgi:hypothetical protein